MTTENPSGEYERNSFDMPSAATFRKEMPMLGNNIEKNMLGLSAHQCFVNIYKYIIQLH